MNYQLRFIFFLLFVFFLNGCANKLFYHPDRNTYTSPSEHNLKYQSIFFDSIDGTKLHAWYIPAVNEQKGLIIHFHGNAQNISGHYPSIAWLPPEGYSVFTFDYRGYGLSQGHPNRTGLHLDSVAALNYVMNNKDIKTTDNIFVLGQSLGGANAIDAVAAIQGNGIKGLIIESTFTSYQDIVLEKVTKISSLSRSFSSAPKILANDQYSPKNTIKDINVPVLFIHGDEDKVIEINHTEELYNLAREPKEFWVIKSGKHLDSFTVQRDQIKERFLNYLSNTTHH